MLYFQVFFFSTLSFLSLSLQYLFLSKPLPHLHRLVDIYWVSLPECLKFPECSSVSIQLFIFLSIPHMFHSDFPSVMITFHFFAVLPSLFTDFHSFVKCDVALCLGDKEQQNQALRYLCVNFRTAVRGPVTNRLEKKAETGHSSLCASVIRVVVCELRRRISGVCTSSSCSQSTYHGNWSLNCIVGAWGHLIKLLFTEMYAYQNHGERRLPEFCNILNMWNDLIVSVFLPKQIHL